MAEEFVRWATVPSFAGETRYLEALSRGEYLPEILFPENPEIVEVCVCDPVMKWKMQNLLAGIAEGKVEPISFG